MIGETNRSRNTVNMVRYSFIGFLAIAAITKNVIGSEALMTNPLATSKASGIQQRTFITRDIKTPDPVPVAGQEEALELMRSGRMYRYNIAKGEESVVSLCEQEIAAYTDFKYCVALNSCGSALMLLLKTSGLKPGEEVLSNAFTFGAVPSAIEHAGGKVSISRVKSFQRYQFSYAFSSVYPNRRQYMWNRITII